MNKPYKDSMEYEQLQKIAKIMIVHATVLIERAQKNGVTLKELMDYLNTPEGYNQAIQYSTQIYSINAKDDIFKPMY